MWLVRAFGALDIRDAGGRPPLSLQAQPKRIALLAYLVLRHPGELHRRDSLLALFWPELDQSHGRNALSQALSFLRRQLGGEVLVTRGNEEVGLASGRVRSDVADFEEALAQGDSERALNLYAGDLLDGLYVQGAAPFVDWVDRERARLRVAAADAAWRCAAERLAAGKPTDAERAAQRALALVPTDESRVREFVDALANGGDRAAALRFYQKFAAALATELEVEPAPETVALMAAVRSRTEPVEVVTAVAAVATPPAAQSAGQGTGKAPAGKDALPRAHGAPTPVPPPPSGWWPRRRVGIGAVIVLGTLLLGGYEVMRDSRTGAPDTLIGQGVVSRYVQVVVADFASPQDPGLGLTVAELLREKIGESDIVRPVDAPALGAALRRMERDSSAPLDAATAREIAVRDGYPVIIAGSIEKVGDTYVLTARLAAATNDSVLGRFHIAVPASGPELVDAVDRMGNDIRARIGESLRSIKQSPPLEQVTARSLEALRLYSEAVRLATREYRPLDAVPLYERAIEVDTTFAAAYFSLSWTLNGLFTQWERQAELMRKAYDHRDRLPEYQRFQVEAAHIPEMSTTTCGVDSASLALYAGYVRRHPDDTRPLQNYAVYQERIGHREEAMETNRRWFAMDSSAQWALGNLGYEQMRLGRFADAATTLASWRDRFGPSADQSWAEVSLAARKGDYDAADSIANGIQERYRSEDPGELVHLGHLDAVRGRTAEAWAHYDRAFRLIEGSHDPVAPVNGISNRAIIRLVALGDTTTAVAEVTAALRRVPDTLDIRGVWEGVGLVYALAGDTVGPRTARSALRKGLGNRESRLEAAAALAAGRPREALEALAASETPCTFSTGSLFWVDHRLSRILAGRAYEALHEPDSAIAQYQAYFTDPPVFYPAPLDAAFLFDTLERLGRLHEARGDGALAVMYYTRAARLWSNADAPLQPRVEELRNRAAAVSALRPSTHRIS